MNLDFTPMKKQVKGMIKLGEAEAIIHDTYKVKEARLEHFFDRFEKEQGIELADMQKKAVQTAAQNGLMILTTVTIVMLVLNFLVYYILLYLVYLLIE